MKNRFLVQNKAERANLRIRGSIASYYDGETMTMSDAEQDLIRELSQIHEDTPIALHVNSPGGSVMLALGIHNALKTVQDRLTVYNSGMMASSATLIPPPGAKVVMPKASVVMIHKPLLDPGETGPMNADDMRKAIECLDAHEKTMASIYAERTGKSMKAVREMMAAETWMSGDDAVKEGFADSADMDDDGDFDGDYMALDAHVVAQLKNGIPERFKNILAVGTNEHPSNKSQAVTVPAASLSRQGGAESAANPPGQHTNNQGNQMKKVVHALVAAGFQLPADASEDQVALTVDGLIAVRAELTAENKELKAKATAERKARVEAHVQGKIDAKIIDAALKDKWVNSIMEKPENQELLDAMKPAAATPVKAPRGAAAPPAEPESGTTEQQLDAVREQMRTEKDPVKIAVLAKKAKELRGHAALNWGYQEVPAK